MPSKGWPLGQKRIPKEKICEDCDIRFLSASSVRKKCDSCKLEHERKIARNSMVRRRFNQKFEEEA